MGKMIELTAADGHKLAAYRAEPAGKPRGAIVVIQEIFGVNSHIKSVADGYAADGYLAIAPAMFDRLQSGSTSATRSAEIQAGIAMCRSSTGRTRCSRRRRRGRRGEERRQGRHRRLLLGRHGGVGRCGQAPRASRPRFRTTAAACSSYMDEKPKMPGHVQLRREGPEHPARRQRQARQAALRWKGIFYSGRPRLQLRPARLLRRGVLEAGARACPGVFPQARRLKPQHSPAAQAGGGAQTCS